MIKKERYYSLDVFRGMTVALMILVNNPGSHHIYLTLEHAPWDGWTLTDLVFPFFLFAVGNAIAFVMPRLREAGQNVFLKKVFKRFALIFLIGLILNFTPFFHWQDNRLVFNSFENLRILGVLQRIAIAYLFAALIIYYFKNTGALIISAIILIAYAVICHVYNASGLPYSFGAGIDKALLGESHMYWGEVVNGKHVAYDPEGIISSFTPFVQVILGYFAGFFIIKKGKRMSLVGTLLVAGILLFAAAYALNIYTPINKKVWTSSYVLLTTGLATVIISVLIYLIEFKNWRGAWSSFFNVFGKNPLFIYFLSWFIPSMQSLIRIPNPAGQVQPSYLSPLAWFYVHICKPIFSDERNASLMYAISLVILMWLIGYWLNKKKIYIKV